MARDLCLLWVSRRGLKTSQLRRHEGHTKGRGPPGPAPLQAPCRLPGQRLTQRDDKRDRHLLQPYKGPLLPGQVPTYLISKPQGGGRGKWVKRQSKEASLGLLRQEAPPAVPPDFPDYVCVHKLPVCVRVCIHIYM